MKKRLLFVVVCCGWLTIVAQQYQVPVLEVHEKMQTGKYQPTWESLETHQTPEWFSVRRRLWRLDGALNVYRGIT